MRKVFCKCMKSWRGFSCWWWLVQTLTQLLLQTDMSCLLLVQRGMGVYILPRVGILWFVLLNRWMSEWTSFLKLDYGEPTRKGSNNFVCTSFCKHESLGLESDIVRWRWELGFIALCVQRSIMGVEVEGVSSNKRTPLKYWAT
jgi:hypothetical protein